ncbi:MAG: hypothetical protein ACRENB_09650 [Gemmatimonadales bacterium]
MSGLFDRLNAELDQIGDRVRSALESSKLHLERSRLVGLRSKAAYKLGMLVYKKERGAEVNQAELDALFARMDDIAAQIAKIDRELDEVAGETVRVDEQPAPAAETAEAEVVSEAKPEPPAH